MSDHQDALLTRLRRACGEEWSRYVDHEFVTRLAAGTLDQACFRHFLAQDYVFLIHFARAWGLAAFKAERLEEIRSASEVLHTLIHHELDMHVQYCAAWGMDAEELERTPEARPNMAYTRYVLERGLGGDALDLLVALAPCVCGYAEIGRERIAHPDTRLEGNPFRDWLETYASDEFQELSATVSTRLDRLAAERAPAARMASLERTFREATRLEIGFWEMGLSCSW